MQRYGTGSLKYDGIRERYNSTREDVLPLWIADMDFPVATAINKAIKSAADSQLGYPIAHGESAVLKWYAEQGAPLSSQHIVTTAGIVSTWAVLLDAAVPRNARVATLVPEYGPLRSLISHCGHQHVAVPLSDFLSDPNAALQRAGELDAFIFSHPHNPTGQDFSEPLLRSVVAYCQQKSILVVADEAHAAIACDEPHKPLFTTTDDANAPLITLGSVSKCFNLAAIQPPAFAVSQNITLIAKLKEALSQRHLAPHALGVAAMNAALSEEGTLWLSEVNQVIKANRQRVSDACKHLPKIKLYPSNATYFAWIDCTALPFNEEQLMNTLVEKAGLAVNAGSLFGMPGWIRINLATSSQNIQLFCERLSLWLSGIGSQY